MIPKSLVHQTWITHVVRHDNMAAWIEVVSPKAARAVVSILRDLPDRLAPPWNLPQAARLNNVRDMNIDVHAMNGVGLGVRIGCHVQESSERRAVMLDLLESVERNGARSQRSRASEVGIALGLVNAYLKYCIKKGFVRVKRLPARGYLYLLTPKGIAEKSQLALKRLARSLATLRTARADYSALFSSAKARGWRTVLIAAASDLAEICILCATEAEMTIVGILDADYQGARFIGSPVFSSIEKVDAHFDCVVIADFASPHLTYAALATEIDRDRILAPSLLGVPSNQGANAHD